MSSIIQIIFVNRISLSMFSNFSDFIDSISLAQVLCVVALYHSSHCKIQIQKQEEIYWLEANSRHSTNKEPR